MPQAVKDVERAKRKTTTEQELQEAEQVTTTQRHHKQRNHLIKGVCVCVNFS